MDPTRYKRFKALYQVVADLSDPERRSMLDSLCPDDPSLRQDVERLVEANTGGVDGFERALEDARRGPSFRQLGPGDRVGPYRLSRRLGEGGMGIVFEAEQQRPLRRTVAVKVIKPGMQTDRVLARFESERQTLAMLSHPNIAAVLDAGATEQGTPFFVMELVDGRPITDFCDDWRFDLRRRLDLFLDVCAGVQHAHQKGIIHRDLKPSNILVGGGPEAPIVKIIDFGVAKALDQRLTEATLLTERGQLVGTPEYMSPEQAAPDEGDVDTRVDVYSLGVLAYELLVGKLPFDFSELHRSDVDEMKRRIREHDPARPSTRLSKMGADGEEIARRRGAEIRVLTGAIRGDLDWIVLRALEKDRDRRYASPSELSADIRRHLEHEPVLAGPPGAAYRARKFVRRHRIAVTAVALVSLAMLGGTIGTTIGMLRALRAESEARAAEVRARTEAGTAQQVTDFLVNLLSSSDFGAPRGVDLRAVDLLDRGARKIDTELSGEPEIRARLKHVIGRAYVGLDLGERGEEYLKACLREQRALLGDDHPDTLGVMRDLGFLYWAYGPLAESVSLLREAVDGLTRTLGPDHRDTLLAMTYLGQAYQRVGRPSEAAELHRAAMASFERTLGEMHPDTLESMNYLGDAYRHLGRDAEAERLYRRALAGRLATLGEIDLFTLSSRLTLGISLRNLGRYEESEKQLRLAEQGFEQLLGDRHKAVYKTRMHLGELRRRQGRPDEAESLVRPTLERWRVSLSDDHSDTLHAAYYLGLALMDQGRHDEAEPLLREAVEGRRRVLGTDHPRTRRAEASLAELLEGSRGRVGS